jgi:hypothetical protein
MVPPVVAVPSARESSPRPCPDMQVKDDIRSSKEMDPMHASPQRHHHLITIDPPNLPRADSNLPASFADPEPKMADSWSDKGETVPRIAGGKKKPVTNKGFVVGLYH